MSILDENEIDEKANLKMANWVACIADQVRNPIASVSGALHVIERELDSHESGGALNHNHCRIALEKAQHRLDRLNLYVTELINFAKPLKPTQHSQNLRAAIALTLDTMSISLPSDCNLEIEVNQDLNIYCDPHCFQTILSALVLNACEAVPATEQPIIKLVASPTTEQNGVKIIIEDNGPGFNGSGPAILQPFNSTKEAGTGMGLAVVNKYMQAHHGQISLTQSEELGGAKVTLFFPSEGTNPIQ